MAEESFDYNDYIKILQDKNYTELYSYYSQETMLEILGVARQENPHSSFIRWLLDINAEHGFGSLSVRKFLNTIFLVHNTIYDEKISDNLKDKNNLFAPQNAKILEEIRYGRYEIINQVIANETILKNKRRADIFCVLQLKFQRLTDTDKVKNIILLIENKIQHEENVNQNKNQTEMYVSDLTSEDTVAKVKERLQIDWLDKSKIINLYVYLNAYSTDEIKNALNNRGSNKKCLPKSEDFITINYQYLLDGVIEPLENMATNEITKQRLTDYIRCLGQSKISSMDSTNSTNGKNEYLIMAISSRERELAENLWKNYQNIIYPIIESLFNEAKYNGFILRDNDSDFWISMANLYRIMNIDDKLNEIVKNSNKHPKFEFNNVFYESRKKKGIGMLARDIICDFLEKQKKQGLAKQSALRLREAVQDWNSNWLREVILLDSEVLEIKNNYDGYKNNAQCKHISENFDDFNYAFFSDESLAIDIGNSELAYVAKYWSADGIEGLTKLLDNNYQTSYRKDVTRIS